MKEKRNLLLINLIGIIVFLIITYINGKILISPSDPLQYVLPVYDKTTKYYFIDRYTLYLVLKFISKIINNPLYIASYFATFCWLAIYLISSQIVYFYSKNLKSIILFTICFNTSPFFLVLSQTIYPTILYLLFFVIIYFSILKANLSNIYVLIIYVMLPFFLFTKIQSLTVIPIILFILYKKRILKFKFSIISMIITFALLCLMYNSGILVLQTNADSISYLSAQYKGRNDNNFPPFYAYFFEPTSLLVFAIIFFVFIKKLYFYYNLAFLILYLFFSVIFIYLFSSRGGPLIFNYNIDFLLFGLILFSIYFGNKLNYYQYILIYIVIILTILLIFYFNTNITNFHPAKYFYELKIKDYSNYQYTLYTIVILLFIILNLIFESKFIFIIFLLIPFDSYKKINSDLNFKIKESNLVYNLIYKYNGNFYGEKTIYLDTFVYKIIPAYKFKLLENASNFLYINNKSTYKLIFNHSENLLKQNVNDSNFTISLNTYLKSIK